MSKIEFRVPDKDAPGYFRRQRKAIEYREALMSEPTTDVLDAMVDWLAEFVVEPADPEAAKEALWDASENQFISLLKALGGGDAEVPKVKDA